MNYIVTQKQELERIVENLTCDIEHIIAYSSSKDEYHYIKQKWLIGRRLAQEEVRLRNKGGIPLEVKTLVSHFLGQKYGLDFQLANLEQNLLFYDTHLNLFESALHLDHKLLPWKHYLVLMDVKDDTIRKKIEKDAYDKAWNIKTLMSQVKQLKRSSLSI